MILAWKYICIYLKPTLTNYNNYHHINIYVMRRWQITIQEDSFSPTRQSSPEPFSSFVESSGIVFLSRGLLLCFLCICSKFSYTRFLVMPQIVGGLADGTSGTLTAPDLDLNVEWHLAEGVMEHLEILVLDDGASGQYRLKVKKLLLSKW